LSRAAAPHEWSRDVADLLESIFFLNKFLKNKLFLMFDNIKK
jgi:hypothetical protein